MNQRSKEILNLLIEKNNTFIQELSEIHEVSERTIRNDIASLNDYLDNLSFGKIEIKQKKITLYLAVSKEVLYQDINKFDVYEYKFSSDERSLICLLLLISNKGYVTLNQLSEKLLASRSTIVNDVKNMRKLAEKHNLKVISKANKGYKVDGKEEDIRTFLYGIISQDSFKILKSVIFDDNLEEQINLPFLENHLLGYHEDFELSEKMLDKFLQYLIISAYRNVKGFKLKTTFNTSNSTFINKISQFYEENNYSYLTKNDLAFIYQQTTEKEKDIVANLNKESIRIQVTVMKFIEKISADLGIDFKDDYIFYENFSAHILRMLRKETFKENYSLNIDDIVKSNTKIQKVVLKHLHIIEENIGRKATKTEFNYIIIHVYAAMERKKRIGSNLKVAVLTERKSTEVFFIESKLVSNFSFNLDIYSVNDTIRGDYDLILTTTPVQNQNYVRISPYITDEDCILIAKHVNQIVAEKEYNNFTLNRAVAFKLYHMISEEIDHEYFDKKQLKEAIKNKIFTYIDDKEDGSELLLYDFLTPDRIQLDVDVRDWKDAIIQVGTPLIERGEITEDYITAVIANIEENGPYVVISKGFAFPHAQLGDYNKKTSMYMIRLKNPIYFDKEHDIPEDIGTQPVRYVCMLSVADKNKHLKAVFNLFNLLKEDSFKKALDACQTSEEIYSLIENEEKMLELRR